MDKHPDGTNVILQLLGKGQCLPHEPRNPLPQGVVQSFDVARQTAASGAVAVSLVRQLVSAATVSRRKPKTQSSKVRSGRGIHDLNLFQVQKWSFALEKTPDLELDLV